MNEHLHREAGSTYEFERDVDCNGFTLTATYADGTSKKIFIPIEELLELYKKRLSGFVSKVEV